LFESWRTGRRQRLRDDRGLAEIIKAVAAACLCSWTAASVAARYIKALAIGAQRLASGGPIVGAGAFGQPGVERVLEILRKETRAVMQQSGAVNQHPHSGFRAAGVSLSVMARSMTNLPRGSSPDLPKWVKTQLCKLGCASSGMEWAHKIKYDGIRIHARRTAAGSTC